ncbi:unnamed protein product (macronuclear) [Paramecium tetraurelia]|uniref:Thioredoxin reductase n=1 Tax=Paramecium tetraurelia TaxID=5888 RepID=A0C460_PARTE|nr:uncharacterized protein GSPATT00035057001 [Paramecium tetraurelia]CAK65577.1 unnamed protein product [Paramecium tetraurelia]|eukprot:XP_001432974.1 hypothetical protein (macronuclear) [Paramecium tetraurelia strain d4-2]
MIRYARRMQKFCKAAGVFDVAVIGGGSGGLAFALEGAKLGLKIAVFDYVTPSSQGSIWGLGGTCVNVGCIPKKLMHHSALLKENNEGSTPYGWTPSEQEQVNWDVLVENVQNHIKGLNYGYKGNLQKSGILYLNELATFKDNHTLLYGKLDDFKSKDENKLRELKFKYCVISTGGRPTKLQSIEKHAITSDDIFSQQKPPGKTLVVGGGYIALECAGMLKGLGYDVTLMTRGKYLREFDQDVVKMILDHYQKYLRVNIVPESLPFHSEQKDDKILVKWRSTVNSQEDGGAFDTVLMAIGRQANTQMLNLDKVGIKVNPNNNKIFANYNGEAERTEVDNIFAIGDVLNGIPELTPVASKSGQLLAKRIQLLIKGSYSKQEYENTKLEYNDYPTTVFTPLEYSFVGLSEEQAKQKFGEHDIEIYHSKFVPLEEQLCDKLDENYELMQRKVYVKAICHVSDNNKVVGLHYLGPNAGEVMQGFGVAVKLGMKLSDLQRTVGIHPTNAEEFVLLKVTKSSGADFEKHGC